VPGHGPEELLDPVFPVAGEVGAGDGDGTGGSLVGGGDVAFRGVEVFG
jgi:hypothetical protein